MCADVHALRPVLLVPLPFVVWMVLPTGDASYGERKRRKSEVQIVRAVRYPGSTSISIEPPSTTEEFQESDSEEDEDRPFTREELCARMLKSLGKRDGAMNG